MPYKITDTAWLDREIARAKGIVLQHMVKDQEYTVAEILALLVDYGLNYTNPEYQAIGAALIADGTIEATP